MTTLEFLGVLLIILVATALLVLLVENLSTGKKSTEGICSECGYKHSMEDRTEDDATFVSKLHADSRFPYSLDEISCIKYRCDSCKASVDIRWSQWTKVGEEYVEHSKRISQDEVVTTFTRYGGKLIPHYQEKKEPPGDE